MISGVIVFHVAYWHVNFALRAKVGRVSEVRDLIGDLNPQGHCSFISPASWHISQSVASTSN